MEILLYLYLILGSKIKRYLAHRISLIRLTIFPYLDHRGNVSRLLIISKFGLDFILIEHVLTLISFTENSYVESSK